MTNYSFSRVILYKISFNTLHNVKHYTTQTIVTQHPLTTRSLTSEREKNNEKIVGDSRHFPPANKEWSNSFFAFNKNSVKLLPVKDKMTTSLIKSYFNLVPLTYTKARSRRMRNLIRRSSTKRIFVSRAEIKQNNDKVIIAVYIVDREKLSPQKKMYFFNLSYKKEKNFSSFSVPLYNNFEHTLTDSVHPIKKNSLSFNTKKNITNLKGTLLKNSSRAALKTKIIKNSLYNYSLKAKKFKFRKKSLNNFYKYLAAWRLNAVKRNKREKKFLTFEKNFFRDRLSLSVLRKKNLLRNIFFFCFIKWTLSIFNINVTILKPSVYAKNIKYISIKKGKCFKILKFASRRSNRKQTKNGLLRFNNFKRINIILLQFLLLTLKKTLQLNNSNVYSALENKVYFLFKYFRDIYLQNFIKKYLKKERIALDSLYMLSLNKFKFEKYLPGLKLLLSKIYNKKIELNLINLKYLHLNSDIFTESIAIKLRKKQNSLLRVIRKSLKLIKIPYSLKNNSLINLNMSAISNLNQYKTLDINNIISQEIKQNKPKVFTSNWQNKSHRLLNYKDILNILLTKMFPTFNSKTSVNESYTKKNNFFGVRPYKKTWISWKANLKKKNVFKFIKYKWITGVRLEAKGRLTKRFTASRSVFRFRYLGNLKNIDCSKNNLSTVMLRGHFKPNIQYSFAHSKKRIGAFGIKGWISSN